MPFKNNNIKSLKMSANSYFIYTNCPPDGIHYRQSYEYLCIYKMLLSLANIYDEYGTEQNKPKKMEKNYEHKKNKLNWLLR